MAYCLRENFVLLVWGKWKLGDGTRSVWPRALTIHCHGGTGFGDGRIVLTFGMRRKVDQSIQKDLIEIQTSFLTLIKQLSRPGRLLYHKARRFPGNANCLYSLARQPNF